MKNLFKIIILSVNVLLLSSCNSHKNVQDSTKYMLVIHGGAGTIEKKFMTPEKEEAYTLALTAALQKGYEQIKAGKTSLDAVEAAINVLEDCPLFNAGRGAVFTHDGKNELDASIMDGKTLKAGAVAGVTTIKNPINAARAVMEKSAHVMMIGRGAELFAMENGCDTASAAYFFTQERWDQLQRTKREEETGRAAYTESEIRANRIAGISELDKKFGTVGAVALDKMGNLAAGTSTGGMTNKRYGRVGDSPIIGGGTYCNNQTAGISCTGWGEFYIREVAAHRVSSLIELKKMSVEQAVKQVIDEIGKMGGDGGIISLDKSGNVAMEFNTSGMYRGTVDEHGKISVHIYK
ncbi:MULTISPECIES: isoaspartyl peptidase/L-asparaginase family protein [Sphingobacterium]|uniref:isoaspartyl peptidase/L-asparaginase family protein n=1 Tax=Sphingobacterium TaxID=28453 RepID=UPI000EEC0162|nr:MULTISPECIES: isoaspartyl peptidase/L-asparaginase [Sphingobacterium]QQT63632.1 isoaspartyl peptidase/L-asparaginase [Sphingobacterium multivorum]HAF34309.1 beta-aspartyl-peptidase [Sphingobacterium sp.]HCX57260.1 beta-aspartyl-peptidase [Sphingobacterium sp.]